MQSIYWTDTSIDYRFLFILSLRYFIFCRIIHIHILVYLRVNNNRSIDIYWLNSILYLITRRICTKFTRNVYISSFFSSLSSSSSLLVGFSYFVYCWWCWFTRNQWSLRANNNVDIYIYICEEEFDRSFLESKSTIINSYGTREQERERRE